MLVHSFFLVFLLLKQAKSNNFCYPHNACLTYTSYFNPYLSKNCVCIADVDNDPDIVATNAIHTSEFHQVATEDGYIIGIFRLPRQNPKGVVVLHHPMTVSSRIWMNYGNKSSAIEFWQQGYDVWLPNNRGTQFSRKHQRFAEGDWKYWDFDFHEIGLYDHKAIVDYIYKRTNRKLYYVGHSMATTSLFIYSAYYPEEANSKVQMVFAMAPISSFQYVQTPAKHLAQFWKYVSILCKVFGIHSFIKSDAWYLNMGKAVLVPLPLKQLFVKMIALFCGWTPDQFDPPFTNLLVISGLAEMPLKALYHYAQIAMAPNGRFQLYDYGNVKNLLLYRNLQPPQYPIEKITVPVYLMYSQDDSCSTVEDNRFLYSQLQNRTKIHGRYEFSGLNHLDYHVGKDRFNLVYNKIMEKIDSIEGKKTK